MMKVLWLEVDWVRLCTQAWVSRRKADRLGGVRKSCLTIITKSRDCYAVSESWV